MKFLAYFLLCGSFVNIESLNPRSVNVALETILEFDGKHSYRDAKAIDKLQSYLTKIKSILGHSDDSRRHIKDGFKFRDFVRFALQTISTYDDNDLLDIVAIANNEIRKYHYKGCKFYELVENQNLRRQIAQKLVNLNDLTAKELRHEIDKTLKAIDNNDLSEKQKKMLDYLDSVYVGDDINGKMRQFTTQLDQFKQRSKRASLNLVKVVKDGVRSVIFDHYSSLNDNARKELKNRLEIIWKDTAKVKEDLWNISQITEKPLQVKNTINQAVWKTVTIKAATDLEIEYPKSVNVKKSKSRNKKSFQNLEQISVTEKRKRRKKTITTKSTTASTTTTTTPTPPPATIEKESSSTEIAIDSAEIDEKSSTEMTEATTTTTSKHIHRHKHRKTPHQEEYYVKKNKKVKKKTTPMKETSVEDVEEREESSKFSNAEDSLEVYKKRFSKKHKRKQRKGKRIQRRDRIRNARFKAYSESDKTTPSTTKASQDFDDNSEIIYTRALRKHFVNDRSPMILYSSDRDKQFNNKSTDNDIKVVNKTTPNVIRSISRIEKVLDEIKDIVNKNGTIVYRNVTTKSLIVNVTTPKENIEESTAVPGRKSLNDDKVHDLDVIDNNHPKTTKVDLTRPTTEEGRTSKRTIQFYSFNGVPAKIVTEYKKNSVTNSSTKSVTNDDIIISTRKKMLIDNLTKGSTISSTTTKKTNVKQEEFSTTAKSITTTDFKGNETRRNEINKQNLLSKPESTQKINEKLKKILNETQLPTIDNVIGRFDDENKEMNAKIDKKIKRHVKDLYNNSGKEFNNSKPFDFQIDDPFNLKDDIRRVDEVF